MHAALLALALAAAPPPSGAAGSTVVVKREGARLMAAARFYGRSCPGVVKPGQRVAVLERVRGWARVAAPGDGRCWLHETAWSDRVAGDAAGAAGGGARDDAAPGATKRDVELAARGFSEEEEARYRGEHQDLDAAFAAIEAHLARGGEPAPEALTSFAVEGGLEAKP